MGKVNGKVGFYIRTQETRQRLSASLKGHKVSQETRNKISTSNTKHGEGKKGFITAEYKAWAAMKTRCYNKKQKGYHLWGGKGIKVCPEWFNFEQFLKDMGRKPNREYSLDRIDNNGNYSKENCKWSSRKEQNNNRKNNIKFNGETAKVASIRLGGSRYLVGMRIRKGWDLEKAFKTPKILAIK